MSAESFQLFCRLFGQALLEIREAGLADKNRIAYHLSDMFHNMPASIAKNYLSNPAQVMADLRAAAAERGFEGWLENASRQLSRRGLDTDGIESDK